jgi:hypothetical protein
VIDYQIGKDLQWWADKYQYYFEPVTAAYIKGEIGIYQYINGIKNALHAAIYRHHKLGFSQEAFDFMVNYLIEVMPTRIVLFKDKAIADMDRDTVEYNADADELYRGESIAAETEVY